MDAADLNNLNTSSASGSQDAPASQDAPTSQRASSQRYCTPEFMSHDFCTPDDQVQDLNWSQPDAEAVSSPQALPPSSQLLVRPDTWLL